MQRLHKFQFFPASTVHTLCLVYSFLWLELHSSGWLGASMSTDQPLESMGKAAHMYRKNWTWQGLLGCVVPTFGAMQRNVFRQAATN